MAQDLAGDILLVVDHDSARVDDLEMAAAVFGKPLNAIARNAGLVSDNRAPLSGDPIEKSGFTDVRPAHNDDCGGIRHVSS
jgi:hypothetical protein